MNDMKPQFLNKRFSTNKVFFNWLGETSKLKISFEDKGQDLQNMWVHSTGEILHCDFHARIYNGKFVNINEIKVGEPVLIYNDENSSYDIMHGLVVSDLKTNNEGGE